MKKPISQAYPFLETPSVFVSHDGEYYTSPFFFSRLAAVYILPEKHTVTDTLPASQVTLPKKGLIGKKSSSCHLIGARWFDPELGMWLVPDAAGQFHNPYSFGGNPVNGVDADGNFLRWKISGDGFSIGFNLTPIGIPLGAGINVGFKNGGSLGGYGEVGYAVGGTGMGAGATVQTSTDVSLKNGSVTQSASADVFGGVAGWNVSAGAGGSYNYNSGDVTSANVHGSAGYGIVGVNGGYDFISGDWNGGVGLTGSNSYSSTTLGLNYSSAGHGSFDWSLGGEYNPSAHAKYIQEKRREELIRYASAGTCDACVEVLSKLDLTTANEHWRNGDGSPLYVDIGSLDLKNVGELPANGQVHFAGKNYSSKNDALVYGTVTLFKGQGRTVVGGYDRYNFDMKPWRGNVLRNVETMIGRAYAGSGRAYDINFTGTASY